jgi:hypothetical protein
VAHDSRRPAQRKVREMPIDIRGRKGQPVYKFGASRLGASGPLDGPVSQRRVGAHKLEPTVNKPQDDVSCKSLDARPIFEVVRNNLGILSALVVVFAVSASTVFLVAYLSLFDWRLIWFIEYSDLLKVGLIVLGAASVSLFPFTWMVLAASAGYVIDKKSGRSLWVSVMLGFVLLFATAMYVDWNNEQKRALDISVSVSLAWTLFVIFLLSRSVNTFSNAVISAVPGRFVFALSLVWILIGSFTALSWGTTFGFFVRDSDGFKQDVTLKNEELKQVGVIMITSHHVILYSDRKTIVVPSSDVVKIEGGRR